MKKSMLVLSLLLLSFGKMVSAQVLTQPRSTGGSDRPMESLSLNFTKVEGANTVALQGGKGTIKFNSRGDKFSDVVFTDASGKTTRLIPAAGGSAGAPKQECKYPIPDACFATADKSIGLCLCRPTNLAGTGGGDPNAILIGLLLPATKFSAGN